MSFTPSPQQEADRLSRTEEDRKRWLYTAITRAERRLVIVE